MVEMVSWNYIRCKWRGERKKKQMPHKFKEGFLSYYEVVKGPLEKENHERMFVLARTESVSDE